MVLYRMKIALIVYVLSSLLHPSKARDPPFLASITPSEAWDTDEGLPIKLKGSGLAFFKSDCWVVFASSKPTSTSSVTSTMKQNEVIADSSSTKAHFYQTIISKGIEVTKPFRELSFSLPSCENCGQRYVHVECINEDGSNQRSEISNSLQFHFKSACQQQQIEAQYQQIQTDDNDDTKRDNYQFQSLRLPHMSRQENCTICRQAVNLAVSMLPNGISSTDVKDKLRSNLLKVCNSRFFQAYGSPLYPDCLSNIQLGCDIFVDTMLENIIEKIYNSITLYLDKGLLGWKVCTAMARCDGHTLSLY
eukprot:g1470.t1